DRCEAGQEVGSSNAANPSIGGGPDKRPARALARYDVITINHEATIGPSGPRPRPRPGSGAGAVAAGGGAGPRSGWKRYTLCVFGSTQIVFAPANVGTVWITVYLSADS